ncbi:acyl-CoA dehydrogenase family protein [Tomitella biformata]|uniref:acyl-CoA dehydrogenase family protein n=1 Tax=Tomitella biformata TaxID=630403 RepID=UPI0004667CA5|nr:acyl-CoA dehydrogenase family protein [Tomitella biformata]
MDFTRTEAQTDLAGLTRSICDKLVNNDRQRELDASEDHFDARLYAALAEAGVLAAALPESVGGGGFGPLEQSAVLTELGRALAAVPYLPSIVMAAGALAEFGSPSQQQLAAKAATGQVVLTAAIVEDLNPDQRTPATTAELREGRWILNGAKTTVPAAPLAQAVLIPATTPDGVAVFVVDAADLAIERQVGTDFRSLGSITLADVAVSQDRLLGTVADGAAVLDRLLDYATVGLCAEQFGILERSLELTSEYAREREQFDRPIGSFQAVAQRLADAYIDVQGARLTQLQAAWRLGQGSEAPGDVAQAIAVAKFWAADAGHRVAHTTVHIHGGVGLDRDHPVHRYFLGAKHNEFWLGSASAQLLQIGASLAG